MDKKYIGKWRIIDMEQWDLDYIDLVVPGYFYLDKDHIGNFQFGTVEGEIDYRIEDIGERERIEFSWMGFSENEPECGRGYAVLNGNELHGRLFFHMGDDSWFKAKRIKT